MSKWKDAYMLELDLWSANETPMRESLFGAGMRHAQKEEMMQYEGKLYGKVAGKYIELDTHAEIERLQKRIEELEAVIAEFIYVESKGGADE